MEGLSLYIDMAMNEEYKEDLIEAKKKHPDYVKLLRKLKKMKPKKLDNLINEEHDRQFENIDCLDCGNCCDTTSPIFRDVDVKRIAKHFRMKPVEFEQQYLKRDEDDDLVLLSSPCAFLGEDNACSIYEVRPLACREYPHTDRKRMDPILDLTLKNSEICPAVSRIFKQIEIDLTR